MKTNARPGMTRAYRMSRALECAARDTGSRLDSVTWSGGKVPLRLDASGEWRLRAPAA